MQATSTRIGSSSARHLGAAGTLLACTLTIATALPAAAATYYVDNTNPGCSNTTGSGTVAIPYCTIMAAVTQHQGAGNTIMVMAGTYREQVSIPAAGVSGSPFVIQAASPAVTVDGADDFRNAAQWSLVSGDVWLANTVTWAPKQVFADGARLAASAVAPASMPARSFQYVAGTGLYVNAGGGTPAGHGTLVGHRNYAFTMSGKSWVSIQGFTATHAEDKGILIQLASNQVQITDNRSTLNFKFGIQVSGSNGCLVARNAAWDNGGHGIALTAGSSGCTVEDNESYRNADPAVRIANGIHLFGAPSNLIQRNRLHDNQDSGEHIQSSSNNCISLQNRSWSNGDHGFDHLGSTGSVHVGDVAWGNYKDGFSIEGSATGTQLYNCIMVDNGLTTNEFDLWVEGSSAAGFVSNYNIIWNSTAQAPIKYVSFTPYNTVADYSAASGQDAQTLQADPRFVNPAAGDFHLRPGSPAIDNATSSAPSWPATDANGLPRLDDPATPNAGAGTVDYADRGALEFPPAVLALTPASGTAPLTVTADATGSMGPDGTVASYRFDFGDGAFAGPQSGPTATHTYAAGQWTATVTVTDRSAGTNTATATVTVTAPTIIAVDKTVAASTDDAEETSAGKSVVNNNDLEMALDGSTVQTIGMRWTGLAIPPRAIITSAYIQFVAKDSRTGASSLTLRGQAADAAATFTSVNLNVSSRPRTTAAANWSPAAWVKDQAGADQRTPDLKSVIQEIVARPGWASGNALAIIVIGSGVRNAYSYDGGAAKAPKLHVEYTPDFPPTARLSVRQSASPLLTVVADASASTDTDPTPIVSYRFDFGDGTPAVVTAAPTATAQHTYAAPGTYTVALVATDAAGIASAPVTSSIVVTSPPTARLSVTQLLSPPFKVNADASASTDTDATPIASFSFDFGDGTPAVVTTVPTAVAQHTYGAAGSYNVTLTATDTGGLTSTPVTVRITLDSAPIARLSVAQAASPSLMVNADASASTDGDATPIASYRFDFGDSTAAVVTAAPTATAQHTYVATGVYTVTLIATDSGGFVSAPVTARITVNLPPTAHLSASQIMDPPLTVSADASASTDPDPMPIARYRFDFGDGSRPDTIQAPTAVTRHTYAAVGTYTVILTATDTGGLTSAPDTVRVTVDSPPAARVTVTQVATPFLTVIADASASTDTDGTPIAGYRFDFGDGSAPVATTAATAQHTYAAPGTYTVRLIATDTAGYASAPAIASVAVVAMTEVRVAASSDDAEETSAGKSVVNNNDLEMALDGTTVQTVGMRWTGLAIPPRAIITAAYIQFVAKDSRTGAASLTLRGQAADAAATFTSVNLNVSSRPRTTAASSWSPAAWVKDQAGADQRTSDLAGVIQEIVNRPGWASGNALAVIVTGSGVRNAYSYDGGAAKAPKLHVEYTTRDAHITPRLSVSQVASPALSALADASASTADSASISSYRFDFGDGSPAVVTTAPTATAQHTYAAAGTYTVALTVTAGGATSTPATASITVSAPGTVTGTTLESRVASWQDDVEQTSAGAMLLTSSDLELTTDGTSVQTVGMRWSGLAIPQGASITAAYIQFGAKESHTEATSLTFRAHAADNAGPFTSATGDLSARPRTTAATPWTPAAWVAGEAGASQRTPDLRAVIQEIVSRPGWASGNALAIIVDGTGHRTAWANDGDPTAAPLLHVEFTVGAGAAMAGKAALDSPPVTVPRHVALSTGHPNPAAGPISFVLELPEQASIHWAVYDIQGRSLWSEQRVIEAGTSRLSWSGRTSNGSPAGSGLYFVRVKAGTQLFVRKIVRL